MNKDLEKLQQLLEQVTAASDVPEGDMTAEAASLRETWVRFGQLLEATPPAALDIRFPSEVRRVDELRPSRKLHRWLLSAAGVLAASVAIGLVVTWSMHNGEQTVQSSPDSQATVAVTAKPSAATATPPTAIASHSAAIKTEPKTLIRQERSVKETVAETQWDEAIDEQINQVGRQIVYANQNTGSSIGELVGYGIEEMRQDLEGNGL